MLDQKLKACPFCGSEEVWWYQERFNTQWLWRVECVGCGCRTGNHWYQETATKAWNKRKHKGLFRRNKE